MSQQSQRRDRLPILLAAVGVGVMLIASGTVTFVSQERAVQVAIASTETALAPTLTSTLTVTPSETPTITLTPTDTPTGTLPPTFTPTATFTASPTPVPPKPPKPSVGGYATPVEEQMTAIPTPVQPVVVPDGVVNIMLLGSNWREASQIDLSDSIIIVSINRKAGTVNMLSLPRDLYVYIPGWKMERINTAAAHGSSVGWPGGGPGLLKDTLLYNFGITIHYYARVQFDNFEDIVDILGGIDVPVDCPIQGWALKVPRRERSDFSSFEEYEAYTLDKDANWEIYTMPVGVQHLDGYMALWYARLRERPELGPPYTDYDRARRQQKVLRAILSKGKSLGFITNPARLGDLWTQYSDLVETDMGLGNMLQLAPIAADIDSSKITSYVLASDRLTGWITPTGAQVSLPIPGVVEELVALAMQPPSENYLVANTVKVEIRNGTSTDRMDEVAADVLTSEKGGGMLIFPTGSTERQSQTVIYDFTGRSKGGQLAVLKHLLGVKTEQVIVQVDPNRAFDYVVILGADYLSRTCTYTMPVLIDPLTLTVTPVATPTP